MTNQQIREKFKKFFESKGHKWVESASLLPTDPSVLFTTAGMQQFKPYYTGEADAMKDFGVLNTASLQKVMRTSDIDEVGDETHLTFFQMLGNFSFGGYWKELAIAYAYEFIVKELGLKIDYVSVFGGEDNIPADEESEKIWQTLAKNDELKIEIKKMGKKDNFWGPTGDEGPCGPTTEIYVSGVEVWNVVFNEYYKHKDGKLENLKTAGIDTGMGLERLAAVIQKKSIFETDLFGLIMESIPKHLDTRTRRIIADHLRTVVFLASDGVIPSNKDQGYVLRRLMRRVMAFNVSKDIIDKVIETYESQYPELRAKRNEILDLYSEELAKFNKTLRSGLNELKGLQVVDAAGSFKLYESFGLPFEVVKDAAGERAKDLRREDFEAEFKKHQEKSRAGAAKKFGGHGLLMDTGELKAGNEEELKKATRLHTATHLLHAALRKVLGNEVKQAGSDITSERLRFDFSFSRKLTPEELQNVEDLINEAVKKDFNVTREEMAYEDAIKSGAMAFFKLKYPPKVKVYSVGDFSKELCGGPHVSHTAEIGKVKIIKEEAVSAGVRRIRAVID
jgi:alanyl-tRNA synthetase